MIITIIVIIIMIIVLIIIVIMIITIMLVTIMIPIIIEIIVIINNRNNIATMINVKLHGPAELPTEVSVQCSWPPPSEALPSQCRTSSWRSRRTIV